MSTIIMENLGGPRTEQELAREQTIDVFAFASGPYRTEGAYELEKLVYGEKDMRLAVLTGMIIKSAILFAGVPGGGKTGLAVNAYRGIDGLQESDTFLLPPDSDMQGKELAGGEVVTRKVTMLNGKEAEEEKVIKYIDGALSENHFAIVADELSRINPYGVNAMLSAPEERLVRTGRRTIHLQNFRYMISTMNPSEGKEATYPVGHAITSRHGIGVVAGNDTNLVNQMKLFRGELPDPSTVNSFVSTRELDLMYDTARQIPAPLELEPKWIARIAKAERLMFEGIPREERDHRKMALQELRQRHDEIQKKSKEARPYVETPEERKERQLLETVVGLNVGERGRMIVQVGAEARALALLGGSKQVRQADFDMALRFALGSRIGARVKNIQEAPKMLDSYMEEISKTRTDTAEIQSYLAQLTQPQRASR